MNRKHMIILFLALIIMACLNVSVYATGESFVVKLVAENKKLKAGDTVSVTLKLSDFENITGIYAFSTTIDYDTNVFEELDEDSFTALNSWSAPTYNKATKELVMDSSKAVSKEEDIVKIEFKVKSNVNVDKSNIEVKNALTSEGEYDIKAKDNSIITLNVSGLNLSLKRYRLMD